MTDCNHRGGIDLALRAGGAALVGTGWLIGRRLEGIMPPDVATRVTFLDMLLAAAMFASLSLGFAMLLLGGHLLDKVQVSERWAARRGHRPPPRKE
ncbi:MAG: hypothetical protein DI547_07640 [Sphingobium sp.]|nr:MAG: hypothetical protein DI547_07640 [Sphingobium sp.]